MTNARAGTRLLALILPWAVCVAMASPQRTDGVRMQVTYVTAEQVYFNAGEEEGVSPGDTVAVYRLTTELGRVVIAQVAGHSSVARFSAAKISCVAGDIGILVRKGSITANPLVTKVDTSAGPNPTIESVVSGVPPSAPVENTIHGRVALQYIGEVADDSRLNIQEPGLSANIVVGNLAGTAMSLSLDARGIADLTAGYYQFGTTNKTRLNVYGLKLSLDRPENHFGFAAGRMSSQYVSSLGLIDGGQVIARESGLVGGIIAGRAVGQSALGIEGSQTKSALFVGYEDLEGASSSLEGTIAYARQTLRGNLDRQFMALQGSAFLGDAIQAFGNAELELNGIQNGVRTSTSSLSNASLFINYSYAWWLSTSLSYDESRSVYLFETMRSIPDSLFDEALQHGFRLSVTTRITKHLSFTGAAGYRYRSGDPRPSHTLTGSMRAYDMFETGINATIRYSNALSPFLSGNDATVELDRVFFQTLDLTARYNHYAFGFEVLHQVYLTQTFSLDAKYRFSRSLYGLMRGDYIPDNTMNSIRVQLEIGIWL